MADKKSGLGELLNFDTPHAPGDRTEAEQRLAAGSELGRESPSAEHGEESANRPPEDEPELEDPESLQHQEAEEPTGFSVLAPFPEPDKDFLHPLQLLTRHELRAAAMNGHVRAEANGHGVISKLQIGPTVLKGSALRDLPANIVSVVNSIRDQAANLEAQIVQQGLTDDGSGGK